jgi:hypothetical protein
LSGSAYRSFRRNLKQLFIMARLERPTSESSNPATKFLQWKSNDKCFSYYDKSKGENVLVPLPLKFVFLEHYHTIKGWNDKTESGIYSNEVFLIGQEPLTVKAFKGGEIASGLYSDIRNKVKDAGGVYHRSVYVMLEDGEIANLQFKGSAVSSYSDFFKENQNNIENDSWCLVSSAKEGKKGAVKFTTPDFKLGDKTTPGQEKQITECVKELQIHMSEYFTPKVARVNSAVNAYDVKDTEVVSSESDDLEF